MAVPGTRLHAVLECGAREHQECCTAVNFKKNAKKSTSPPKPPWKEKKPLDNTHLPWSESALVKLVKKNSTLFGDEVEKQRVAMEQAKTKLNQYDKHGKEDEWAYWVFSMLKWKLAEIGYNQMLCKKEPSKGPACTVAIDNALSDIKQATPSHVSHHPKLAALVRKATPSDWLSPKLSKRTTY